MKTFAKIAAAGAIAAAWGLQSMPVIAGEPPVPSDAKKLSEQAKGGGTHAYYRSKQPAPIVVSAYRSTLEADGWTIESARGGGSAWGGNAVLSATKGGEYLVMTVDGGADETNIDLCVWPTKPANDDC